MKDIVETITIVLVGIVGDRGTKFLAVHYKDNPYSLLRHNFADFRLELSGKFFMVGKLIIEGIPVIFETDNDEQYRALVSPEQSQTSGP